MTDKWQFLALIIAVLVDGMAGIAGGLIPSAWIHRHITKVLAYASGTLLGAAFLDLLPHALHEAQEQGIAYKWILLSILGGFVFFYLIEVLLGSHAAGQSGHKHEKVGPLILVGDAMHNATDGVALALAFSIDIPTGIITALAVILHELPQEIGDYSLLITHGYSKRKALFWLFLVQMTALVGALLTVVAVKEVQLLSPLLLAVSSGGFLYIASADILPELQCALRKQSTHGHRHNRARETIITALVFLFGVASVYVTEQILDHLLGGH